MSPDQTSSDQTSPVLRPPKVRRPTPIPRTRSALLDALAAGDVEMFWERVARTLPLVEETETPGEVVVTFCWRDRDAEQVLLFANRLTDERNLEATLLERLGESDLWHASFRMAADWRASYSFLVQHPGEQAPWIVEGQAALRQALDRGRRDPRNPATCTNRAGVVQSVVALPDAPAQPWLAPRAGVPRGTLHREVAPAGHEVWLYDPPGPDPTDPLPLVVALDGEVWTSHQSLPAIVDNLIADRAIPPVRAVLVASGGRESRWTELGGSAGAGYLTGSLVGWVRERRGIGREVVAVGQSLGGLTALRAGLSDPRTVTGVVSQSASLWMDDLADLIVPGSAVRIHLAHGRQEWVLAPLHADLERRLRAAGIEVHACSHNGGHDYAWWRGDVADGLITLLGDPAGDATDRDAVRSR
ncbi:MAG: DUF3327 domain-containing protein [Nocardioides sp.]|uniref:enterochelin esterase domain-containing protein n=1 Tax=Nocardioides sp. TaxID=35761 RepID=UPI0039E61FDF